MATRVTLIGWAPPVLVAHDLDWPSLCMQVYLRALRFTFLRTPEVSGVYQVYRYQVWGPGLCLGWENIEEASCSPWATGSSDLRPCLPFHYSYWSTALPTLYTCTAFYSDAHFVKLPEEPVRWVVCPIFLTKTLILVWLGSLCKVTKLVSSLELETILLTTILAYTIICFLIRKHFHSAYSDKHYAEFSRCKIE
jgi:hypothetical protein